MKNIIPSPGSEEALTYGCTCPVMDNLNGMGFLYNGRQAFYISDDCPLHGRHTWHKHEDTPDVQAT